MYNIILTLYGIYMSVTVVVELRLKHLPIFEAGPPRQPRGGHCGWSTSVAARADGC